VWITIFDNIEDDEYDGELKEDDLDRPRIQIGCSRKATANSTIKKSP
jgi:hypothetical protein